jgi:hypothetical protein
MLPAEITVENWNDIVAPSDIQLCVVSRVLLRFQKLCLYEGLWMALDCPRKLLACRGPNEITNNGISRQLSTTHVIRDEPTS